MQGAIYCGVPAANTAFKITLEHPAAPSRQDAGAGAADAARACAASPHVQPAAAARRAAGRSTRACRSCSAMRSGSTFNVGRARRANSARAASGAALRPSRPRRSARPPGPYAIDDLVDDAARLISRMGPRAGRVHRPVDGRHGRPGPRRSAIRIACVALVLANTTSRYPDAAKPVWQQRIAAVEAGGIAAVADAVVERYLNADFRAAHPDRRPRAAREAAALRRERVCRVLPCHREVDWLDRLHSIRVPTLVIAGARDVGATPEMAKAIAAAHRRQRARSVGRVAPERRRSAAAVRRARAPLHQRGEVNHPRSAFGASPSRRRRRRTGEAGSAAAAWLPTVALRHHGELKS